MSFSTELKAELCNFKITCKQQAYYELLGIILFGNYLKSNSLFIMSDNKYYIDRIINLLKNINVIDTSLDMCKEKKYRKKFRYFIDINNPKIIKKINSIFNTPLTDIILKNEFLSDFIRGVFLSCGNISNPSSNYHMEFIVYDKNLINLLTYSFMSIKNFKINSNHTSRRNTNIAYIKESETIVDLLTYMGAPKSSMNFIQTKMIHELRNYVNRTNNFETANISKTTKAASMQINAINKIKNSVGLDVLPNSLKEIAKLRLSNPYMSLSELSLCLSKPLSRSGINHRLKKIVEISHNI